MIKFIKKHPVAVLLSVFLHIGIAVFFTLKWEQDPVVKLTLNGEENIPIKEVRQTAQLEPMQTFAVDSTQVQAKLEQIKAEQEARKKEQEMLKQLTQKERERLKQLQQKKQAEQAKAEKARKEAAAEQKKAEAERKKIAQAKRLAEVEKKKADEARKKADAAKKAAAEAEKQRIAEERKKKELEKELALKAEEKKALEKAAAEAQLRKQQQEAEAELQRQLAEEAEAQRAAQKRKQLLSLRETYISSISAKVKDNWRTPARISPNAQCDLKITQSPQGMITSVKVLNCNKDATRQFQQAAEKAVYRAEPLPAPPVKELFEREITFEFKP